MVTPLSKTVTGPDKDTSRYQRVIALEPNELVRLWQAGGKLPSDVLTVLTNTPAAYQHLATGHGLWLLETSAEAAVALGVDAVADTSAADRLRTTKQGRETVRHLREAGIPRTVVFDGGHHLPALSLEPEIAILPVLNLRGVAYTCHVHLRDAVPVPALAELVKEMKIRTRLCTTPRLLTMAKTKKALAQLTVRALDACGPVDRPIEEKPGPNTSGPQVRGILSIDDVRGISTNLSALDILRERIIEVLRGL